MSNETKLKLKKLGTGALVAVAGALATYAVEAIPSVNLGSWTPLVTVILSVGANAIRKFLPVLAAL